MLPKDGPRGGQQPSRQHIRLLTKFQFFKYFQEHEGKTPTECQKKWDEMLPLASPNDITYGEVRIRVCVDEYELHRNSKSRINEVKASLKDVKKPKPETMQALKENLDCRQEVWQQPPSTL